MERIILKFFAFFPTFLIGIALWTSHAEANLEDFQCDERTDCPEEMMPIVEGWVRIFTEINEGQKALLDENQPNVIFQIIPSTASCGSKAISSKMAHLRVLLDRISHIKDGNYTQEEQKIVDAAHAADKNYDFSNASIRCQTGRSGITKLGLSRYLYYRDQVVSMIRKANFPEVLQYLILNESEYNMQANSGVAKGPLQFKASTWKNYGPPITDIYDPRENLPTALQAALKYFVYLDKLIDDQACMSIGDIQFHEKWPLMMNAYHSGELNLQCAIGKMGPDIGKITTQYRAGSYRYASASYVAQIYAKSYIANHMEQFFGEIPVYQPATTIQMQLLKPTTARVIAKKFDLPVLEFKKYNLGYSDKIWLSSRYFPAGTLIEIPYTEENFNKLTGQESTTQGTSFWATFTKIKKPVEEAPLEPIDKRYIPLNGSSTNDIALQPVVSPFNLTPPQEKKTTLMDSVNHFFNGLVGNQADQRNQNE